MDPIDALAQHLGLPDYIGNPSMQGGHHILWPAPEDAPFREAFILDREHYKHRLEGVAVVVSIIILLMARGWWLKGAIIALIIWLGNMYLVSMRKVGAWNEQARLRAQGRLIEPPPANPLYTVQPVSRLAELY